MTRALISEILGTQCDKCANNWPNWQIYFKKEWITEKKNKESGHQNKSLGFLGFTRSPGSVSAQVEIYLRAAPQSSTLWAEVWQVLCLTARILERENIVSLVSVSILFEKQFRSFTIYYLHYILCIYSVFDYTIAWHCRYYHYCIIYPYLIYLIALPCLVTE